MKPTRDQALHAVRTLLSYAGDNPDRQGLLETPERVVKAFDDDWFSGYRDEPEAVLKTFEDGGDKYDGIVFQGSIPVTTFCEHHMASILGVAHFGYIPDGKVVGLSKMSRLIGVFARRLQVQERLTLQIVDSFMNYTGCRGCGLVLKMRHMCYSEDTEVLTDRGFVPFSSLDQTELVAQYDVQSGRISYTQPLSYVATQYYGPMHHWNSKSVDLLVTPEHRMLIRSEWGVRVGSPYQVQRANTISQQLVYMPTAGYYEGEDSGVEFIQIGDLRLSISQYCGFMGIYLSDGSFDLDNERTIITKGEANQKDYADVREFLFSLPLNWKERRQIKGGPVTGFQCHNAALANYCSRFGKAFDKYIPNEVFQAPLAARQNFLTLLLMGDGWAMPESSQMGAASRSRKLAEGYQRLWITSGYGCRMTSSITGGAPQWISRARQFRGNPKESSSLLKENRVIDDYKGIVYCVNVPSGALIVRRNGAVVVSGNCMESRGIRQSGTITTTSSLRGIFIENIAVQQEFMSLVRDERSRP
jgi:GTP cyclohydrolase I